MPLLMRVEQGDLAAEGRCVYRSQDYSLTYEIAQLDPPSVRPYYVMADTLTLVFRGTDTKMNSLDSYTNRDLWSEDPLLKLPAISARGALLLAGISPGEYRYTLPDKPHYFLGKREGWVRIVLCDEASEGHFEIGRNLLVGLAQNRITDLILSNVVFL